MTHERDDKAEKRFQAALADERRELGWMPNGHEAFRRQASTFAAFELADIIRSRCESDNGYRYAPEVLEAIGERLDEIRELLETGHTLFDPDARRARASALKARSAAANPDLRSFLDGLVPPAS